MGAQTQEASLWLQLFCKKWNNHTFEKTKIIEEMIVVSKGCGISVSTKWLEAGIMRRQDLVESKGRS